LGKIVSWNPYVDVKYW